MNPLVVSKKKKSSESECDEFTISDGNEEIIQFSNIELEELQGDDVVRTRLETYDLLTHILHYFSIFSQKALIYL